MQLLLCFFVLFSVYLIETRSAPTSEIQLTEENGASKSMDNLNAEVRRSNKRSNDMVCIEQSLNMVCNMVDGLNYDFLLYFLF